jgi:hypothetical protein
MQVHPPPHQLHVRAPIARLIPEMAGQAIVVCFAPVAQLAGVSVVLPLALAALLRYGRPSAAHDDVGLLRVGIGPRAGARDAALRPMQHGLPGRSLSCFFHAQPRGTGLTTVACGLSLLAALQYTATAYPGGHLAVCPRLPHTLLLLRLHAPQRRATAPYHHITHHVLWVGQPYVLWSFLLCPASSPCSRCCCARARPSWPTTPRTATVRCG